MKILTIILSLYVALLSTLPCEDMEIVQQLHSTQQHSEAPTSNDACSVLCICNCCGINFTTTENIYFGKPHHVTILHAVFNSHKPIQRSAAIWQPPKVR